jgi:hypothetical protein
MKKNIQATRDNPRDWTIDQLEAVASRVGLTIRKSGGSHVVFQKTGCPIELSVPARKPIKPVYITKFLELLDWRAK